MSISEIHVEGSHNKETEHAVLSPKWGTLEAHDANEQAHNLKGWQQHFDQISHGAFYGRIDEVSFKGIHSFKEHTNQGIHQHCSVAPDSLWLGLPAENSSCRINGQQVDQNSLMLRQGNTEFELVTPQDFTIYGIVIDRQLLQQAAEHNHVNVTLKNFNTPIQNLSVDNLNQLRQQLERIINAHNQHISTQSDHHRLVMMLLSIFETTQPKHGPSNSLNKRRQVVKTVIDYVQSHPEFPANIEQLCQIAHVSRRTLQYSFEQVLGTSPLRYLRAVRLNQVRRKIQQGLNENDTITSLAQHHGFWHSGQFSHDYTQLFGENPSETRQQMLSL
jgi:AraC family ethanolamine operon transcriptional activator